jgi:hypothetical protein
MYSLDSVVCIATGYGQDERRVGVRVLVKSGLALGSTQSPIQLVLGAFSRG